MALFANIGETEAQIEARYGKQIGQWTESVGFRKAYSSNGLTILVYYLNNVAQMEKFQKNENGNFSGDELEGILETQSGFNDGRAEDEFSGIIRWRHRDGYECMAVYSLMTRELVVARQDFVARLKEKRPK